MQTLPLFPLHAATVEDRCPHPFPPPPTPTPALLPFQQVRTSAGRKPRGQRIPPTLPHSPLRRTKKHHSAAPCSRATLRAEQCFGLPPNPTPAGSRSAPFSSRPAGGELGSPSLARVGWSCCHDKHFLKTALLLRPS